MILVTDVDLYRGWIIYSITCSRLQVKNHKADGL